MAVNEKILAVKKGPLFEEGSTLFQGTLFEKEKVEKHLDAIKSEFTVLRRGAVEELDIPVENCAERNKDFKQPIPYIVIAKGDKLYVTERLAGAGEARLRGKLSMGIGGHMNPIEGLTDFAELLTENTLRELDEELTVKDSGESVDIIMGGLINDDSDDVGQVHIGLLGNIKLKENQDVEVKEVEQLKGAWYTLDELLVPETFERLESWGKIVVKAIQTGEYKI